MPLKFGKCVASQHCLRQRLLKRNVNVKSLYIISQFTGRWRGYWWTSSIGQYFERGGIACQSVNLFSNWWIQSVLKFRILAPRAG